MRDRITVELCIVNVPRTSVVFGVRGNGYSRYVMNVGPP